MRSRLAILSPIIFLLLTSACVSATTEVHVVRCAEDSTVLGEDTVDYKWMEQNLPVKGDGKTHYYMQGPVFEGEWNNVHPGEPYNTWNPREDVNSYPAKDMGAVKGTDIKDLCELVGGASDGDEIQLMSNDGFSKKFDYEDVYNPESRQGEIVLTWWKDGSYAGDGYGDGMRNVFFADTSTNEWGEHIFGNQDMKETLDEKYWHYYYSSGTYYPATTGLSAKYISTIKILTDEEAPPGKITVKSEPKGADVYLNDEYFGTTDITIEELDDGEYEVRVELDGYKTPDTRTATVTLASETTLEFILEENFSGYSGQEMRRFKKSEVDGSVNIFLSEDKPYILKQGRSKDITLDTGIENFENITYSRLWVYVGESHKSNDGSGIKPEITLTAEEKKLITTKEYFDRKDDGDREYSATFAYSPELNDYTDSKIELEVTNTGTDNSEFTLYGIALLTEEKNGNITTFWEGYEGCDIIWPGYEENDESHYSYASPDEPDSEISGAEAVCIATAIKKPSPEDISFVFNNEEWTDIFEDEDYGLLNRTFDVFLFLDGASYSAGIKSDSSESDKGYIEARNLIFSVTMDEKFSSGTDMSVNLSDNQTQQQKGKDNFSGRYPEQNKSYDLPSQENLQKIYPHYCEYCISQEEEEHSVFEIIVNAIFSFIKGDDYTEQTYDCDLCRGYKESHLVPYKAIITPVPDPKETEEEISSDEPVPIESYPEGAMIFINETYTGKITPSSFRFGEISNKTILLRKEGFENYSNAITIKNRTIKPDLLPADDHISERYLHTVKTKNESVSETGSLYIKSTSEDLMIFIDNRDTFKKTPGIISGIKEGTHTVRLKSHDIFTGKSDNYGSRKVYVYDNCITPLYVPDDDRYAGEVLFVSDRYKSLPASVNGIYQGYKIPFTSDEVCYGSTYLCINDDDKFISFYIPSNPYIDKKLTIPEYTGRYYKVFFDSEPQGADIFIDGFDTEYHTPYLIPNISAGHHKVMVSKPGYIPEKKEIMVHQGEENPFAGEYSFTLEEFPAGTIFADTIPSGAKVYLNDIYTGSVTPVTIPYLNIGTYKIKFVNGSEKSGLLDITVCPFEKTEIIQDMR